MKGLTPKKRGKKSYYDLKVLVVKLLQEVADNPSDSTAMDIRNKLQRHTPRYELVGPPGQQRTKKHRDAKKARAEEEARKAQEYIAKQSDRHGSRGEISGGWDWRQIENVTAAHDAAAGGSDWQIPPARRSRGNGFRCFGSKGLPYIGNGPDSFDKFDGTADTADNYLDSRLSQQDEDDDTGTPHVFKSYDQLLCESVEDPYCRLCPVSICRRKKRSRQLIRRPGRKLTSPRSLRLRSLESTTAATSSRNSLNGIVMTPRIFSNNATSFQAKYPIQIRFYMSTPNGS